MESYNLKIEMCFLLATIWPINWLGSFGRWTTRANEPERGTQPHTTSKRDDLIAVGHLLGKPNESISCQSPASHAIN